MSSFFLSDDTPGDSFVVPRLALQGVAILDEGAKLLDQFSPLRDGCF